MLMWAIFYDDGAIFSNLDGQPWEAPFFGVVAIACVDGLWFSRDRDGLIDYLQMPGGEKCVRLGRMTTNERYNNAAGNARVLKKGIENGVVEEGNTYYCWMGKA